jgi:hypothetical protein
VTDAERGEVAAVLNALMTEAEILAKDGHLRASGLLLTARQTIRFLCTRLTPEAPAAETVNNVAHDEVPTS